MRSVVPVLHVWSRWFDACGWHLFLYTNFKYVAICIVANRCEEHEASMRSGAPVLHVGVWSRQFEARACIHFCVLISSQNTKVFIYIVANMPTQYEASMTTLVVLWHCLFGGNFGRGDIFVYKYQVKNFQSIHIVTNTGRKQEASRPTGPLLFVGLKLAAYVYFCVLLSSHNTNVFMLYSRNDPYIVRSVHRAFGRL